LIVPPDTHTSLRFPLLHKFINPLLGESSTAKKGRDASNRCVANNAQSGRTKESSADTLSLVQKPSSLQLRFPFFCCIFLRHAPSPVLFENKGKQKILRNHSGRSQRSSYDKRPPWFAEKRILQRQLCKSYGQNIEESSVIRRKDKSYFYGCTSPATKV